MKKFIKYWVFDLTEDEPINWKAVILIALFCLVGSFGGVA